MPKMVILPKMVLALGGYIRETVFPYTDVEGLKPFPYRNIIVGNPLNESVKIEVPVYDEDWIEKHKQLGLIIVTVNEDDDFVGLFKKVKYMVSKE
ncbi:energy-converting hydrogenase B subunit EhbP [Methanocaldococcus indicus]|uniref:energy-converting hydrogenase B subunit EhbP n=1 Tax=Methanocaldococcus indicus TaxID=213231 RepID=UPI003C6CFA61